MTDGSSRCPTSFPNPNALGASFNSSMWNAIGATIGLELRALWVGGATEASHWSGQPHAGLDCWSPNININRDPRWGRNQEVPSEDPKVNGDFGKQYTLGLQQGADPKYIQGVVTLKHWAAYSLEDSDGFKRQGFDAQVSAFDLTSTYLPAFEEAVVDGGATGVMCSYNAINGVPTCASTSLNKTLRDTWGFDGYVTSDTGAVEDIYKYHKYVSTAPEAACAALKGGTDIDSGKIYSESLLQGVSEGHCSMADVKLALRRTLGMRFRLGLFDPIEQQPYWHVPPTAIASSEAQQLNLDATRQSIVLLKNAQAGSSKLLPLPLAGSLALIGPHVDARAALVGNYLGQLCPGSPTDLSCVQSPEESIRAMSGGTVLSAKGSDVKTSIAGGIAAAVNAAAAADRVVLFLGLDESVEAEGRDRISIDLPQPQRDLAAVVLALGKPTVVVLLNGGSLAIQPEAKAASAVVEAFYPGFLGAQAIAETIFGLNPRCCGKLPFTIYPANYVDQVKMSDMNMRPNTTTGSPGRTYRYFTGKPLWPFGYGLSLTQFALAPRSGFVAASRAEAASAEATSAALSDGERTISISISELAAAEWELGFSVEVRNVGSQLGDTVLFAFVEPPSAHSSRELRHLAAFERVHLAPGAARELHVTLRAEHLALTDEEGRHTLVPGEYHVSFSDGASDGVAQPVALRQRLLLSGAEAMLPRQRGRTASA